MSDDGKDELWSRREFLVAGTGAAFAVWRILASGAALPISQSFRAPSYVLPQKPLQNPAFRYETLGNGTLLWTTKQKGEIVAFRLNDGATRIWQACDGRQSADEISKVVAGAEVTPEKVRAFIGELIGLGLVVNGGHVRTWCRMVRV